MAAELAKKISGRIKWTFEINISLYKSSFCRYGKIGLMFDKLSLTLASQMMLEFNLAHFLLQGDFQTKIKLFFHEMMLQ